MALIKESAESLLLLNKLNELPKWKLALAKMSAADASEYSQTNKLNKDF